MTTIPLHDVAIAGGSSPIPETSASEADGMLERLTSHKGTWVRVPTKERIELLRACSEGLLGVADAWVAAACRAKRVAPDSVWAGEEWISGPMVTVRYLRLLIEALESDGHPAPRSLSPGPGDRTVARVFPASVYDSILYPGITADVWMLPGALPTQGRIYADKRRGTNHGGRVCLVLGAGNVGSIAPTDLLYKLFVEDQVVLVKMNPVNEYLGPLLRRAFRPLVERGFLEFAYGGPATGDYLCRHPLAQTLHLTGSHRTHDAIVWGSSEQERLRRKADDDPRVDKPFTAELGCVSPVIVVPGRWTAAEIDYHARNVAGMVVNNASFNCNAAKVLIVPESWRQRDEFVGAVRQAIARVPPRPAYYPGAAERYGLFLEHYPNAVVLSRQPADVPWTWIPDVPARPGEYALCNEAFCGVIAEVPLGAGRSADPGAFLSSAVRFVNEHVWGTLSCTVLAGAAAQDALGDGLLRAVAELRYGAIGVNVWAAALFALGSTTWGAYPGNTSREIGSGAGIVHNSLMFEHAERSVAWASPRTLPKPPWFPDHANLVSVGRKVTHFEASPSILRLPGLGLSALLG